MATGRRWARRGEVIEQRDETAAHVAGRSDARVHAHVDRSHLELGAQPAVGQGIGLVKGRRCGDTVRALEARRDKLEHLGAQPAIPDEVGCLRGRVEQHEELGRVLLLVLAVEKLGEVLSEHAPRTPADGGVGGRAGGTVAAEPAQAMDGLPRALIRDELSVGLGARLDALLDRFVKREVVRGQHRQDVPQRARPRQPLLATGRGTQRGDGLEGCFAEAGQL